jgi:hypothetical protein
METHVCIFLFDDNGVFRYKITEDKNGKPFYKLLLYENDEKSRVFSQDFWKNWERDTGYAAGDYLDYAIVSDKQEANLEVPSGYQVCDPTKFFTPARIRAFMEQHVSYSKMTLSYCGKTVQIRNQPDMTSGGEKIFFLTIPNPAEQITESLPFPGGNTLGAYCDDKKKEWIERRGLRIKQDDERA